MRVALSGQALLTVDGRQPSIVRVLGGAELTLNVLEGDAETGRSTEFEVSRGVVRALVWIARDRRDRFVLQGPHCAAEIAGGECGIAVDADGTTTVRALTGEVTVRLPAGQQQLQAGRQLTVRPDGTTMPAVGGVRLALNVDAPARDFVVRGGKVRVSGQTAVGALVCANGEWLPTDGFGRFDAEVSVEPDEALTVAAMDASGRRVQQRLQPARDTVPPRLHLDEP
jgi:hypothetical protein